LPAFVELLYDHRQNFLDIPQSFFLGLAPGRRSDIFPRWTEGAPSVIVGLQLYLENVAFHLSPLVRDSNGIPIITAPDQTAGNGIPWSNPDKSSPLTALPPHDSLRVNRARDLIPGGQSEIVGFST
jgi:hypothetical protein